jgi:hypothetical protein
VDARLFANINNAGFERVSVSLDEFVARECRYHAGQEKSSQIQVNGFGACLRPSEFLKFIFFPRRCILYLKLFLLGGFTWIFEVLSYTFNDHAPSAWIWMIVDFFNCLHGVLIFLVLILLRQRIRKELAGKTILFYTCPAKWADVENDEEICLDCEGNSIA